MVYEIVNGSFDVNFWFFLNYFTIKKQQLQLLKTQSIQILFKVFQIALEFPPKRKKIYKNSSLLKIDLEINFQMAKDHKFSNLL